MTDIHSIVGFDNSWPPVTPSDKIRDRTIELRFDQIGDKVRLLAWGQALGEDGGGQLSGELKAGIPDLKRDVANLYRVWDVCVVSYSAEKEADALAVYPFEDTMDISEMLSVSDRRAMIWKLARQGHHMFSMLFRIGDEGLVEIGDKLSMALNSGEQIIRIHSDSFFVPWAMLYTPGRAGSDLEDPSEEVPNEGFWGYSHLLEHALERDQNFQHQLRPAETWPLIGMNVNLGLDEEFAGEECVQPVINFFANRTSRMPDLRTDRPTLARALAGGALPDQVSYFGCHASAGGIDGTDQEHAHFTLGDGDPIHTTDVIRWLDNNQLNGQPVVFVNACQGGRLSTLFYPSFGRILLAAGANCLIGPQVDVTPRFAREYAKLFFGQFFNRGSRVGDIVHGLARNLLEDCANPLGLTVSLYRGLDTHIAIV